jgi:cell division septum initiation protein DivIVA
MVVDKLLDLQALVEDRRRPSNMSDDNMPFYYSQSKDQFINILFMDLVHMVNAFKLTLEENEGLKEQIAELESMPTMVVRQASK